MRISTICAVLISLIAFLALSTQVCALPQEVAVESKTAKLAISLENGSALLKSIANKETGEMISFAPESADFILTTDKGELNRASFKVSEVITHGNVVYIVMNGADIVVTQRYEVYDSGYVKRSLQVFPKTPIFIEKVSLIDLKTANAPAQRLFHNGLFLRYNKGGFFMTVEMPMLSRIIKHSNDGFILTAYEPMRQIKPEESMETVPAVFCAWTGNMPDGYDAYRQYTYDMSVCRTHASVRTSSEHPTNLTTAYDGCKAVDDDESTRWKTANVLGGTHWLEIEFPEPVTFNTMKMLLDNREARPSLDNPAPIGTYRLQVWANDGWKDIASGSEAPTEPVKFPEVRVGKARLLIEGCHGRFSLWDFRLYRDAGSPYVIAENLCSKFWIDKNVRMPFTYFNTWYAAYPGIGRLQRARGLLTYQTVLPMIPLAAECGIENFVLDAGWKYDWYGTGLNPQWPVEFTDGEKPFTEAADNAGINLAAWFNFFRLRGDKYDHQWRVVREDGSLDSQMCLSSGYYDFVKNELLSQTRNSHMRVIKFDGFVPRDYCYATNHNHKPGKTYDAEMLAFMRLVDEIRKQYPFFRTAIYSGAQDSLWIKYTELIHTFEDHGGLTPGELAPTRAKANYMHDREMFNHGVWQHLLRNQMEGSAIIVNKTAEWREQLISNMAQSTRRQVSVCLSEFTADERNWIRDCMNWSRRNAKYLEQIKTFLPNPAVIEPWRFGAIESMGKRLGVDILQSNSLEGYAHILDNEGYIFIFNPTFYGAEYSIPISKDIGFNSEANGLSFQTVYPYLENIRTNVKFGDTVTGYLPAEKSVLIKVSKQPIPTLAADCRYVASETIWDSVNMSLRAAPTTTGGMVKTKLILPTGTAFEELTVNGKAIPAVKDGSYEITLQAPIRGSVASKKDVKIANGKKIATANVSVSGDLLEPSLMLFLYRFHQGDGRVAKAAPGELDYSLLVDGKPIQGAYGETLEKDWETEKNAGWWVFKLPVDKKKFTVTVETNEKIRPVLLLAAKQDNKEAVITGKYARGVSKALLTSEDKEVFFHQSFPDELEYFLIIDLVKE